MSKTCEGLVEIQVLLQNKQYTYILNSGYAVRQFQKLKYKPGKAINLLKKWDISKNFSVEEKYERKLR